MILIFIGSLNIGGTEKQLLNILKELHKNFKFKIFTVQEKGLLSKDFEKLNIEVLEPRIKRKKGSILNLIIFYIFLFYDILKTYSILRPKIVHYYLPHSYILAGFLSLIFKNTQYIMSRRSLNDYQKKYPFINKIESYLHKKMNLIIANSNAIKQQLIKDEGVISDKCKVIYNGVNINRNKVSNKKKKLVKLVCVANLLPYKNHEMILKALSLIPKKYKWHLDLIGKESKVVLDDLNAIIKKNSLTNRIFFHGQQLNPNNFLKSSDIALLTSDEEGFSNSILEYLNYSLPVVVTNVGGNSESVRNNINGFLIQKGNYNELSKKILYLFNNPNVRKRMGREGYKIVSNEFALKKCIKQYNNMYKKIIDN
ncbi:glycosyltransferase [Rickettsiales bacterium]|nr:glycosyltransferase [Rickettsiales bacterium]